MAQILIPGGGVLHETSTRELLLPGGGVFHETAGAPPIPPTVTAMPTRTRSGLLLEPADTGINAQLIAALATFDGPIIPWALARQIRGVTFFFDHAGTSTDADVLLRGVTLDGQTFVKTAAAIWSTIDRDSMAFVEGNNGVATVGTITLTETPQIFSPYMRLSVINNDAANSVTVSLRALLME